MTESNYKRATTQTATDLRNVAESLSTRGLTRLSLPEIDAVIDLTSKVIPAGNDPDRPGTPAREKTTNPKNPSGYHLPVQGSRTHSRSGGV